MWRLLVEHLVVVARLELAEHGPRGLADARLAGAPRHQFIKLGEVLGHLLAPLVGVVDGALVLERRRRRLALLGPFELLDELPGPLLMLGDSLLRDFFMMAACLISSQDVKVVPPRSMLGHDLGRKGVVRLRRHKYGPTLISYAWWRPIGTYGPDEKSELREAAVILTNGGLSHAQNEAEAAAWLAEFRQWMQGETELQQRDSFFANEYTQMMQGNHRHMTLERITAEYRRRGSNRLPIVALHEQLPAHFPSTLNGEFDLLLCKAIQINIFLRENLRETYVNLT